MLGVACCSAESDELVACASAFVLVARLESLRPATPQLLIVRSVLIVKNNDSFCVTSMFLENCSDESLKE